MDSTRRGSGVFPTEIPSPVNAIHFRMEQAGLEPRDLEPYIGSCGKVSDVLSGKQPLTLPMIRALHQHLGIPVEVLLQDSRGAPADGGDPSDFALDWSRFPLNELMKRGWVRTVDSAKSMAEKRIRELIDAAGGFRAGCAGRAVPNPSLGPAT
jgi:HTH-type transcriptional regulator/antitoxin HigA